MSSREITSGGHVDGRRNVTTLEANAVVAEDPVERAQVRAFDLPGAFAEHSAKLESFLIRLGMPPADAEDLVAETFLIAHRERERFQAGLPVRPWLFGIAANLARRHQRRRWLWSAIRGALLREEISDPRPGADLTLMRAEEEARVHRALEALPHRKRTLLVLREFEGMSAAEIGQVLGMNENTVYSALHHARKALARAYEALAPKEEP